MAQTLGQWLMCLRQYGLMCLFLSSPERLPSNPFCTLISVSFYLLIGLLLVDEQRGYASVTTQIILELVMLAAITYAGLYWKKKLQRFSQTYSALVGINMVISAASIPSYQFNGAGNAAQGDSKVFLLYITLLIIVWNLAVLSLIFKRAMAISTQLSAMISFTYFVIYQIIVSWLVL